MNEVLLGFDVRVAPGRYVSLWTPDRRETFLLQDGGPAPRSIDVMVWPSVFDQGQGIGLSGPERVRLGLSGIALPAWTGPNPGLWQRLDKMIRYLTEHSDHFDDAVA